MMYQDFLASFCLFWPNSWMFSWNTWSGASPMPIPSHRMLKLQQIEASAIDWPASDMRLRAGSHGLSPCSCAKFTGILPPQHVEPSLHWTSIWLQYYKCKCSQHRRFASECIQLPEFSHLHSLSRMIVEPLFWKLQLSKLVACFFSEFPFPACSHWFLDGHNRDCFGFAIKQAYAIFGTLPPITYTALWWRPNKKQGRFVPENLDLFNID